MSSCVSRCLSHSHHLLSPSFTFWLTNLENCDLKDGAVWRLIQGYRSQSIKDTSLAQKGGGKPSSGSPSTRSPSSTVTLRRILIVLFLYFCSCGFDSLRSLDCQSQHRTGETLECGPDLHFHFDSLWFSTVGSVPPWGSGWFHALLSCSRAARLHLHTFCCCRGLNITAAASTRGQPSDKRSLF